MSFSVSATRVRFDLDSMWVELSDGRTIGVPLAWFPRLLHSTEEQREQVRISSRGLHWEALDEDISIAGLLAGLGGQLGTPLESFCPKRTTAIPMGMAVVHLTRKTAYFAPLFRASAFSASTLWTLSSSAWASGR
jgi:hypothetical protein